MKVKTSHQALALGLLIVLVLAACEPSASAAPAVEQPVALQGPTDAVGVPSPTPLPTREPYPPGTLVDYTAQTGDTLPALASHFNTTVAEIRQANPILPQDVTTLPPGLPMKIPIYYQPLWGSPFQILPDSLFVNGPAQVGFDPVAFVDAQPGWLKNYTVSTASLSLRGGQIVQDIATTYSVSPRLLLALLEYQAGALSQPQPSDPDFPLGYHDSGHHGVYNQLIWAANTLNNGYYGWRIGDLREFDHPDGRIERPDPWQNAASVALQYYFSKLLDENGFYQATHAQGFLATYTRLFGDPWANVQPHIPGSLVQPALHLPFIPGETWAFTGGPHTGWGLGDPLAAMDFAPPSTAGGCTPSNHWVIAMADGVIARSSVDGVVLDLDGDGDERTGWEIFYLHLATQDRVKAGTQVKVGDALGHPSCEGGEATGTHVHIARKYNGEWIPATGPLAFNLEGWIAQAGAQPYEGTLQRFSQVVRACTCSDSSTNIRSDIALPQGGS